MKRLFTRLLLCAGMVGSLTASAGNYWTQIEADKAPRSLQVMHPTQFTVYTLNETALKTEMWNLSENPDEGIRISLPIPDGTYRDFIVWQTPIMPEPLAARYPDIKTFTGHAADDQRILAKMEFTLYGFTAMIYDGANISFVDPYDNYHDGIYMAHYKRDEYRAPADRMKCEVKGDNDPIGPQNEASIMIQNQLPKLAQRTGNGWTRRTYRLALSADSFYCRAATGITLPTIAQALSKMTTSMNRINGVYNVEFSVQMNFCANEDTLIFGCSGHTNGNDPFATINSSGNACLTQNQTTCTNRIGSANFDVGHVFTTGAGGISAVGAVCNNSMKAKSVTGLPTPVGDGFDIDFVAHEMGHEFGSEHTFNNNQDGSCGGNASSSCAYEPGSGATIMDYAGVCPSDDLQPHSDAYFSASSLIQIGTKLAGSENACAVSTTTGNKLVYLPAFSATYTIPYKTPFELTAPTAVDSVADTLTTYCWTQWNLGDFGKRLNQTYLKGPILRSYTPTTSPTRVFPKVSMVLAGSISNAGVENNEGEKLPDTARFLTFKLAVRDVYNGNGCFLVPDDTIHLNAVQTTTFAGFKVTSQNTTGISYTGSSTQTVTWNVVGTNAAPVSCDSVTIYMSRDGGNTWVDTLGRFANNGTATVTLPNPASTVPNARIKVKGRHNVFFNVNAKTFAVTHSGPSGIANNALSREINIFPVPASQVLHIAAGTNNLDATVYNAVGQLVWKGSVNGKADIDVASWARGVYYVHFSDAVNGNIAVKPFVLQ